MEGDRTGDVVRTGTDAAIVTAVHRTKVADFGTLH
jgi:hypothetical protein